MCGAGEAGSSGESRATRQASTRSMRSLRSWLSPVDAVLAVGDDIGRHVAAAGRVLNVPEPEIPQVLRADEGKERLGGGGGVGGDVVGLGFLAVPEGRGFVLGVETGIQKREQLRGCGHGYS